LTGEPPCSSVRSGRRCHNRARRRVAGFQKERVQGALDEVNALVRHEARLRAQALMPELKVRLGPPVAKRTLKRPTRRPAPSIRSTATPELTLRRLKGRREGLRSGCRNVLHPQGSAYLQESLTISTLVTFRWPCSLASASMVSLAFSLAPCISGCQTAPVTVTV